MVKITYDENNIEERQLVEDYFWFVYYLKVIEFDILRNEDIRYKLMECCWDKFALANGCCRPQNKFKEELITIFRSILNGYELKRFVDIFNMFEMYEASLLDVMINLTLIGIKVPKRTFKKYLIAKFCQK